MGPSSPRVEIDSNGAGSVISDRLVPTSTVRIRLVPSRKRRLYGCSAAKLTNLPFADQLGLLGANLAGASALVLPVLTSTVDVAPVSSWNAIMRPSGDHAGAT